MTPPSPYWSYCVLTKSSCFWLNPAVFLRKTHCWSNHSLANPSDNSYFRSNSSTIDHHKKLSIDIESLSIYINLYQSISIYINLHKPYISCLNHHHTPRDFSLAPLHSETPRPAIRACRAPWSAHLASAIGAVRSSDFSSILWKKHRKTMGKA